MKPQKKETETETLPPGRRVRRRSFDRDLTQGSIVGNLWALTWPTTISNSIMILGPLIDMIWVGSLGTAAIAGVGVSGIAVQVINSAKQGLNTGNRAMLARFVGAGDTDAANHVAQQSLVVNIFSSIVVAAIGLFLSESILQMLGVEADVVKEGAAYMRIVFIGAISMSLYMMGQGIMQASGDAVTPMKISVGIRVLHIILCPFLIFGWWIFPQMGVSGAAMTGVVSQSIGATFGLWILFTGRSRLKLSLKNFSFDGNVIWRIIKIGFPSSVTGMERSFASLFLMWFIVPFGTAAVAAHSLAQRIDGFVHMPAQGLGQASGVLAGQNMGAGQSDRAEKTGWIAAAIFTGVMAIGSIIIWLFAENIVYIFNKDPKLVEITAKFLRIDIVSYMVFGVVVVLMNCLNGMGDTYIPMLTTLLTMWLVQVPLAYILPKITPLGVYGVRWGIVIAIVMRAVVYTMYFKHGRWKHKEI